MSLADPESGFYGDPRREKTKKAKARSFKALRVGLWADHMRDLSAIRRGESDIREFAAVGAISTDHPDPSSSNEVRTMEKTGQSRGEQILGFFQDTRSGRANDIATALGIEKNKVAIELAHLAKSGRLRRLGPGLYTIPTRGGGFAEKSIKAPKADSAKRAEKAYVERKMVPIRELGSGKPVHYAEGHLVMEQFIEATCVGCGSIARIKVK